MSEFAVWVRCAWASLAIVLHRTLLAAVPDKAVVEVVTVLPGGQRGEVSPGTPWLGSPLEEAWLLVESVPKHPHGHCVSIPWRNAHGVDT